MSKTVTGTDAISSLVSHTFHENEATIEETVAYIDVDDAGRRKGRESITDYHDVMWTVMNYMPSNYSLRSTGLTLEQGIDAVYEAELIDHPRHGEVIKWFHIQTGVYDCESLGTHYEFIWEA